MALPYFFVDSLSDEMLKIELDEDTSRHIIQVLRMQESEKIMLTDGKGNSAECIIITPHKKHTSARVTTFDKSPPPFHPLTIAISLIKNISRFEWFLEKATELGVAEIIPLLCERTERQKFRHDRMLGICKSAMLQSMQTWLPVLSEPAHFNDVVSNSMHQQKMIAHCLNDTKVLFSSIYNPSLESNIILIGPEGDFSEQEIVKAMEQSFDSVSLGSMRLRTETAGIFAAAWANGAKMVSE